MVDLLDPTSLITKNGYSAALIACKQSGLSSIYKTIVSEQLKFIL
jgi:hypothetical protein